jgi:hypothetical protein
MLLGGTVQRSADDVMFSGPADGRTHIFVWSYGLDTSYVFSFL